MVRIVCGGPVTVQFPGVVCHLTALRNRWVVILHGDYDRGVKQRSRIPLHGQGPCSVRREPERSSEEILRMRFGGNGRHIAVGQACRLVSSWLGAIHGKALTLPKGQRLPYQNRPRLTICRPPSIVCCQESDPEQNETGQSHGSCVPRLSTRRERDVSGTTLLSSDERISGKNGEMKKGGLTPGP